MYPIYNTPAHIRFYFNHLHNERHYNSGLIKITLDDGDYLVTSNWLDQDGKLTFFYNVGDGDALNKQRRVYVQDIKRVELTEESASRLA